MMKTEPSQNYKVFDQYVFGDYRVYYFDGLPESVFTSLDGAERSKAEKLVLQAIKKIFVDERAIRAAGYLKIREAIPVLERRLAVFGLFMRDEVHSSITWALLKIKSDKQQLSKIIEVVNNKTRFNGLTRVDAVELISEFGKEPFVVDALLHAFRDKDFSVVSSAHRALRKVFKDDQYISDLLKAESLGSQFSIRDSIAKHIEMYIKN